MYWRLLRSGDIAAALLMAALIGTLFVVYVLFPNLGWPFKTNQGFGPDWDCTYTGSGDPVCIKRPTKTDNLK